MRKVPSSSPGKLCNDNIAVAEKIDIEIDVVNRLDNQLVLILKQGRDEGQHTSREMKI
jgi:dynactin complex subunit